VPPATNTFMIASNPSLCARPVAAHLHNHQ
jgi:hypothetical protein